MGKRILCGCLFVVVAFAADFIYQYFSRVAGETFTLQLSHLLFNLRPVVFIIWYILLLISIRWLFTDHGMTSLVSTFYLILGLIVLCITTLPSMGGNSNASIYQFLITISESKLSLTSHSGAFLFAVGVVSLGRAL